MKNGEPAHRFWESMVDDDVTKREEKGSRERLRFFFGRLKKVHGDSGRNVLITWKVSE
jgi:hypothetical protein